MRVLIYSDVHGNLPSFEAMLAETGNCDLYICLGDLVNYGPWSNECVDLALSLPNSINLMGNHEEAFIDGNYPGDNPLVKSFFEITFKNFDRTADIKSFVSSYSIGKFTCTHTINDTYIYPDTSIKLDNNYIVGHSHHQFKYESNSYTLYNAGSVGQNRKFINVCNYLLCDLEMKNISMKSITYPIDLLLNEMRSKQYPEECLNYYESKAQL